MSREVESMTWRDKVQYLEDYGIIEEGTEIEILLRYRYIEVNEYLYCIYCTNFEALREDIENGDF